MNTYKATNALAHNIACPDCGSYRTSVHSRKEFYFGLMAGGGLIMSCLATVFLITLPALIITIPMILLSPLAIFAKGHFGECKACKYRFEVIKA